MPIKPKKILDHDYIIYCIMLRNMHQFLERGKFFWKITNPSSVEFQPSQTGHRFNMFRKISSLWKYYKTYRYISPTYH